MENSTYFDQFICLLQIRTLGQRLYIIHMTFFCIPFVYLLYVLNFVHVVGWLVGCFGFNGPFRLYFSLYRAVSQREGDRGESR